MKNLSKTILAVLATGLISCALFSQQAQANTIAEGSTIMFDGKAFFDTNSLLTATKVTAWQGNGPSNATPDVLTSTGDFATFAPAGTNAVFFAPYIFSPSTPTPGLWSAGGFTFDLATSTVVTRTVSDLLVTGTGTITGNGFDPTSGTWTFEAVTIPGKKTQIAFHFTADTVAVPDGGSAVALLGIALTGIEVLRRKLRTP